MVAWKIYKDTGVKGLSEQWEIVKNVLKKRIGEKKKERKERLVSQRPNLDDIPRPVRPHDLKAIFLENAGSDEISKGNLVLGPKLGTLPK